MSDSELVEQLEEIDAMFVQSAAAVECTEDRMTLRGVAQSTVYFSDRPERVVGHIATSNFVTIWGEGDDSFEDDPPNAVLAFAEGGHAVPSDIVIEITEPMLDGEDLTYKITVLEGEPPARAEGCTLFIDPFGRPLTPVSVAGMRRRTRRRTRRRVAVAR